jgi:3-deoxy-D-manno-octulosonic-acid transferase
MMRWLYTALLVLLTPIVLARLWWRGRHEPGYRQYVAERFGYYKIPALQNCIWIHAVSVGEVRAAAPLIAGLRAKYPKRSILLTCMTVTGRATAVSLFGEFASICYLPYDFPWALKRLFARFQPSVLLVMETEIWFNLLHTCAEAKVPALLVNARLSARSQMGYAKWAPVRALVGDALKKFSTISAQSPNDAARFRELGAVDVHVSGNMKFDATIDDELVKLGERWKAQYARNRRVLLAASTRDGEEALLLAAYQAIFDDDARRHHLLVIVPRHPARFDDVAAQIAAAGLSSVRRSAITAEMATHHDVLLGDSMGEMFAYYAMCDLAFVGGSLVDAGGQNLIEACALGKPVLMGPSTFNFADVSAAAVEAEVLRIYANANDVMTNARILLQDADACAQIAKRAQLFAAAHRGATQKTMALIASILK